MSQNTIFSEPLAFVVPKHNKSVSTALLDRKLNKPNLKSRNISVVSRNVNCQHFSGDWVSQPPSPSVMFSVLNQTVPLVNLTSQTYFSQSLLAGVWLGLVGCLISTSP